MSLDYTYLNLSMVLTMPVSINCRVVELEERMGYGFALKHALYHEVSTPYVCVIQHDRTFMRTTPMDDVVRAMLNKRNGDIKYVGKFHYETTRSCMLYLKLLCL